VHSWIGIEIDASPDLVFALARDVERWADLLPHYTRSSAHERLPDGIVVVDCIARRPFVPVLGLAIPVAWRSRTWSEPITRQLRFVHIAGATRGMDVTWRIEPTTTGCRVEIGHDFRPRFAPFAPFVDRWFTRPIAARTLATFKAIAEATAEATTAAIQSGTSAPTNQRT
jgi:ribosome-associated toxin RatA of RatAB toxin-antitoxin module